MAEYSSLLAHITSIVKANDNQEITGSNMQSVLTDMVSQLGAQQLRGVAVPSTVPSTPSGFATYLATQAGNYAGFNKTIATEGLYLLDWNSVTMVWDLEQVPVPLSGWLRDSINGVLYPASPLDKVAIGSASATRSLDIAGNLRVRTLGDGSAYPDVLVSDANGNVDKIAKSAIVFEKLDKFTGYDRLTVPQAWDIIIDNTANTITVPTLDSVPLSVSNPIIIYTTDYAGGPINTRKITTPAIFNFTDSAGWWYLSFNATGTPICSKTLPSVLSVLLCYVYHDGVNIVSRSMRTYPGTLPTVALERFRKTGAIVYSGFDTIAAPLTTGAPAVDGSNTCVSVLNGTILEGNLYYSIGNSQLPGTWAVQPNPLAPPAGSFWTQDLGAPAGPLAINAGMFRVTHLTPTGFNKLVATRFPFPVVGDTIAFYNASGTIASVPNTHFVCTFLYVVQDWINGEAVRAITSTQTFTSLTLADAYNWDNLIAESGNRIEPNVRQITKLVYESRNTYSGTIFKAALRKVVDLRTQAYTLLSVASSTIIDQNVALTALPAGYTSTNQMEMNLELASKIATPPGALWSEAGGVLMPVPAYGRVYVETNVENEPAIHGYSFAAQGTGIRGVGSHNGVLGESIYNAGNFIANGTDSTAVRTKATGTNARFLAFEGVYGPLPNIANISNMNGDGAVSGPQTPGTGVGWQFRGMLKIEVKDNIGNPLIMWLPYYEYETTPS